jgi:NADH-quinone oxidoreductase subunit L
MTIPLIVLAILSVIGGFIGIPEVLGGHHSLHHFLEPILLKSTGAKMNVNHLTHESEYILMAVAVTIALVGILMAWVGFKKYDATETNTGVAKFFENKWYIDEFYNAIIVKPIQAISSFTETFIEKSGIDGLVNGIGKLIQFGSTKLRLLQSGLVGFYLFLLVFGMFILFVVQFLFNKF